MINLNYNNLYDISTKFPDTHPYNSIKLDSIKIIISSNQLNNNPKYLYPLINVSKNITGQYPKILRAKKSVASFKLRKNSPIGIYTTLRGSNMNYFLNTLKFYIIPNITTNISTKKYLNNVLCLGFNNLLLFTNITPYMGINEDLSSQKKGVDMLELNKVGGSIQLKTNNPSSLNSKKILKTQNLINKYYYSLILRYPY